MKLQKLLPLTMLVFVSLSSVVDAKQLNSPVPSGTTLRNNSEQLSVTTVNTGYLNSSSKPGGGTVVGTASGAILNTVSSATCGGVTYISGQNGVIVNQGGSTHSVSVTNLPLFSKKYPVMANIIAHGGIITSPLGSFYNVNPTLKNACEFTAPSNTVKAYKAQHSDSNGSGTNHISYTISLLTGYNSHNKPVSRANSIVGGSLTNNGTNTSKQYCSGGLNNVIVYNNTLMGVNLVKKTSSEWLLNNNTSASSNQSINLTFTCAGVYQINQFINGKYASTQKKTVTANTITNQNPTIPTPPPQTAHFNGGAPLGGNVVIVH